MNNIVYWTQANGKQISVDDMDINHLRNTLKMIIRAVNKRKEKANIKPIIRDSIMDKFEEEAIKEIEDDYYDEEESLWQMRHRRH